MKAPACVACVACNGTCCCAGFAAPVPAGLAPAQNWASGQAASPQHKLPLPQPTAVDALQVWHLRQFKSIHNMRYRVTGREASKTNVVHLITPGSRAPACAARNPPCRCLCARFTAPWTSYHDWAPAPITWPATTGQAPASGRTTYHPWEWGAGACPALPLPLFRAADRPGASAARPLMSSWSACSTCRSSPAAPPARGG